MHDTTCTATLVEEIVASLKSITKRRFVPMMQRWVSLNKFLSEISSDAKLLLAKAITRCILGVAGEFPIEEDEEDAESQNDCEEDEGDVPEFDEIPNALAKQGLKLTVGDSAKIQELKAMSIRKLRKEFLPHCFEAFVTDDETKCGWKANLFPKQIVLVLRFFHDVNKASKSPHQLIFPTPNSRARYVQITSTILANIWTSYLHYLQMKGAMEKEMNSALFQITPGMFEF
jgi:hypothetical protein